MMNLEKYGAIFKALGEPNRLKIVLMLTERKMCVCEMVHILPVSFSTISSHLKVLLNAGVVEKKREGKWIVYSLSPDRLIAEVVNMLLKRLKNDKEFDRLRETIRKLDRNQCALNYRGL